MEKSGVELKQTACVISQMGPSLVVMHTTTSSRRNQEAGRLPCRRVPRCFRSKSIQIKPHLDATLLYMFPAVRGFFEIVSYPRRSIGRGMVDARCCSSAVARPRLSRARTENRTRQDKGRFHVPVVGVSARPFPGITTPPAACHGRKRVENSSWSFAWNAGIGVDSISRSSMDFCRAALEVGRVRAVMNMITGSVLLHEPHVRRPIVAEVGSVGRIQRRGRVSEVSGVRRPGRLVFLSVPCQA